jgi:xanthine dehydrogenase YagS FAD-binding subunit
MQRAGIDEPKAFELLTPDSLEQAVALGARYGSDGEYLAGGCDLIDVLKHQLRRPRHVIALGKIDALRFMRASSYQLLLGALTRLSEIERDERLHSHVPALALAAGRIASPQIRNLGTLGGNLLQDSRCPYYRGPWYCYRHGGIVCDAHHGINAEHAIFGADRCYTVTPSDLAPVVVALDARIHIQTPEGPGSLAAKDLFLAPSQNITRLHRLDAGEILTAVEIALQANSRSTFIKYAPRNAWDFSRASIAVALVNESGICRNCRVVLGGVSAIPWRSRGAERALECHRLTPQVIEEAAIAATYGAEPLEYNAYKVPLVRRLVREALVQLAA